MSNVKTKANGFTILLADDCDEDIFFYQYALQRSGIQNPIQIVRDGEEVIRYLNGQGGFADRARFPLPKLLLLDIKMPKVNGFEVLEWLRKHERFKRLPVIVISSSKLQTDINRSHDLGANSYMVKPASLGELVQNLQSISSFWLTHAEIPETE